VDLIGLFTENLAVNMREPGQVVGNKGFVALDLFLLPGTPCFKHLGRRSRKNGGNVPTLYLFQW
jgi:hypothetical protein